MFIYCSVLSAFVWTTYWHLSLDPYIDSLDSVSGAMVVIAIFCPVILGTNLGRPLIARRRDLLSIVVPFTLPLFHIRFARVRSVALFAGAVCAILHLSSMISEWPHDFYVKRRLVGLYLGHILLLTNRYGGGDINTVLDDDHVAANLAIACAGASAATILICERRLHSSREAVEIAQKRSCFSPIGLSEGLQMWHWIASVVGAASTGATVFVTLWLAMSTSAVPRLSGVDQTRQAGLFVIFSFAIGAVASTRSPGKPSFGSLVTMWLGLGSFLFAAVPGVPGCVGGCMLVAMLPFLWARSFDIAGRLAQAGTGRMLWGFFAGSLFYSVLLLCYSAALAGAKVPVLGERLQGRTGIYVVLTLITLIHCASAVIDWTLVQGTNEASLSTPLWRSSAQSSYMDIAGRTTMLGHTRRDTHERVKQGLWPALILCSIALLPPAVFHRSCGITPVDDMEQDATSGRVRLSRPLHIASWNVQQAYTLDGLINFKCAGDILTSLNPAADWIALQESDPIHLHSQSHDIVGWLQDRVGMRAFYGQRGQVMTAGSGALSRWRWRYASSSLLPAIPVEYGGPLLNRVLNEMAINVNGTDVRFFGTHLEPGSDPSIQIQAIAARVRAIDGPVILAGDFNLWPSGSNQVLSCEAGSCHWLNDNTCDPLTSSAQCKSGTQDAWKAFKEAGLRSAINPNFNASLIGRARFRCLGPSGGTDVVDGCQTDYIFYRGLNLVESAIHNVHGCSDHNVITASFTAPAI